MVRPERATRVPPVGNRTAKLTLSARRLPQQNKGATFAKGRCVLFARNSKRRPRAGLRFRRAERVSTCSEHRSAWLVDHAKRCSEKALTRAAPHVQCFTIPIPKYRPCFLFASLVDAGRKRSQEIDTSDTWYRTTGGARASARRPLAAYRVRRFTKHFFVGRAARAKNAL
jgi:hypothetical protein